MMRSNGLKGQQWSAQGCALGKRNARPSPCKGKRTIAGQRPAITLLPFQGGVIYSSSPRALPWADHCCPFGAFERRILPSYFLSLLMITLRWHGDRGPFKFFNFSIFQFFNFSIFQFFNSLSRCLYTFLMRLMARFLICLTRSRCRPMS